MLTEEILNEAAAPVVDATLILVDKMLQYLRSTKLKDVPFVLEKPTILLVGGSSRLHLVRQRLSTAYPNWVKFDYYLSHSIL